MTKPVNHPKYETTYDDLGERGEIVVCFKVGYHQQPDAEAEAAYARIAKAYEELQADKAIIKKWGGSLVLYSMQSEIVNPDISDADMEEMKAAAIEAYPDLLFSSMWRNSCHGLHGVSVRLVPKR